MLEKLTPIIDEIEKIFIDGKIGFSDIPYFLNLTMAIIKVINEYKGKN